MINRRSFILSSLFVPTLANAGLVGPQPGSIQDFLVNIGDRCHFDFNRWEVTSKDSFDTLARQVAWLTKYNYGVTIEGHCDERGTREYNLHLGEKRALYIKEYFSARGIDSNRIRTISYGKERPAVVGSNEVAWRENRRGVVVIDR